MRGLNWPQDTQLAFVISWLSPEDFARGLTFLPRTWKGGRAGVGGRGGGGWSLGEGAA